MLATSENFCKVSNIVPDFKKVNNRREILPPNATLRKGSQVRN